MQFKVLESIAGPDCQFRMGEIITAGDKNGVGVMDREWVAGYLAAGVLVAVEAEAKAEAKVDAAEKRVKAKPQTAVAAPQTERAIERE